MRVSAGLSNENIRPTSTFAYLPLLTGLFTATLIISNVLNCKIFRLGPLPMAGGLILFPLAALFGDVLTEVYGYAESRKVIWTGFASLMLLVIMVKLCGALPADPLWSHQAAYDAILGVVPRVAIASLAACFAGEFCNSYVLAKYKIRTHGKLMFLRFIVSTAAGQLVDSIIFVAIAFAGRIPATEILLVGVSGWVFKVVWEVWAIPFTLPVVRTLKRMEGADYFDRKTNFNPLRF